MALVTSQAPLFSRGIAPLTSAWADLSARTAKARLYRRTLGELRGLSRSELRDLGLSPANIKAAAYEAVYG